MKLVVCLLSVILAINFASASLPCDPASAFHGSACSCGSQSPFQIRSYAFAVQYPTFHPRSLEGDAPQMSMTEEQQQWENFPMPAQERASEFPKQLEYTVFLPHPKPQEPEPMKHMEVRFNQPASCPCVGPCNCAAAGPSAPRQAFAPMNFLAGATPPHQLRFRRSAADSEELNAEEKEWLKDLKPVKSKKTKSSSSFKESHSDEIFDKLEGDTYVIERQN